MDFSTRLASVIHDVKNRLQLILPETDSLLTSRDDGVNKVGEKIRLGLMDVNQQLVALLGLYKLEHSETAQSAEVYVDDLLASCAAYVPAHVKVSFDCDRDLVAYFDESLVSAVVSDAVHNAIRFAKLKILLRASAHASGIELTVEDDGPGFDADDLPVSTNGTGLGLYFAEKVALAHRNKGQHGHISLGKSEALGGAAFSLFLP